MTHYYHQATEKLDYQIDWTSFLEGDTIAASAWSVEDGNTDITLSDEDFTTTAAEMWALGGKLGRSYAITNTITTAAGRIESRTIYLDIVERNT